MQWCPYGTNYGGYRYQFTGHEQDGETNYQYHGARYYEEDLARYMSVDPWADKYPGWSTYNYVMSNPLTFIDPTGKGVEYTDEVAKAMAERGAKNGYTTSVVANPEKANDYGVVFQKTTGGRLYRGVQFEGKFTGIGKAGLVSKEQEQKEINAFASAAVYNTFGPPKASGACTSCGIMDPIIDVGQEKLSDGLQVLGMNEEAANYTSAGVFMIGSVFLSRKLGGINTAKRGTSTVYRNFGWNEYEALRANGNNFVIGSNFGSKQFWLDKEGLDWWKSTSFSKNFTAKITVDNNALNSGYKFLDAGKYRAISFDSQDALNTLNKNMKIEWIQYK